MKTKSLKILAVLGLVLTDFKISYEDKLFTPSALSRNSRK